MPNTGFAPQLQALIQLYEFHYKVLKDELGEDPNLASQAVMPRVTSENVAASQVLQNNATDYMYEAYINVMEETARKVACLLNASVSYGAKKYRELLKEEEVRNRDFTTQIKMLPSELDLARLEAMMNNAIASNPDLVVYLDPFKVMKMAKENIELGELYFRQAQKRYIKAKQEQAAQNSQMNSEGQLQSIQIKAQTDAALEQQRNLAKEKQIILQGIFDLAKVNLPIPAELQTVVAEMLQNVEVPISVQNDQQEQALMQQQQMQQQQMEAEQQGMVPQEEQQLQTV